MATNPLTAVSDRGGDAAYFIKPPGAALAAIAAFSGPMLIDLDETLYLRNTTEDFIDSALPSTVALFVLRLLDVAKPWRLSGGDATRDVWRVRVICLLFPWTLLIWKAKTAGLAAKHGNQPLLAALRRRGGDGLYVATNGFGPIVAPLVAALALERVQVVAARVWNSDDRLRGKLWLATNAVGGAVIARSLVLTDSTQDQDLLNACACPLLTTWPEARYIPALSRTYLPGQYISLVKRPGERFIIRGVLQEDFAYWILSSVALASAPALHVVGLAFLLLSLWTIYECGYVDNDLVAATLEKAPKLSSAYYSHAVATPTGQPWIWAAAAGAVGIFFLHSLHELPPRDGLLWAGGLAALYSWFWLYNRVDKITRAWMFPVLQIARSAGFVLVAPILPIGACALAAHGLSRWVPYYIYRFGGKDWPDAQPQMTRLYFLIVFATLMSAAIGAGMLWSWTSLALFAYSLFRARHELAAVFGKVSRLDRVPPRSLP